MYTVRVHCLAGPELYDDAKLDETVNQIVQVDRALIGVPERSFATPTAREAKAILDALGEPVSDGDVAFEDQIRRVQQAVHRAGGRSLVYRGGQLDVDTLQSLLRACPIVIAPTSIVQALADQPHPSVRFDQQG